ncbi:ABC transporter transmembrane domain-containing protein [Aureliella helgolandensis]|uniref:Lipid A export ATP-binding/permease protein MsbA n=1 Tax=Aureliella helgolandensis TaxID=2527968 RepID=A0A518GDK4_9BACT|nr:ABC transporter ATP-binding protein [Aureliella helgolandensis]QDV26628.1 Lipid A export ATP-binding/permease protein MsbA [Aureliella helgolandensis]
MPLRIASLLGGGIALCVPVAFLLLGTVLQCLMVAGASPAMLRLSNYLPDLNGLLPPALSPLAQVIAWLAIALVLMVLMASLLFLFYYQIHVAAVRFEVALIARLRKHARALATVRTLSAQQTALTDCLDYHLPRVRASLGRWWRTFPRHAVQLISCSILACLLQPLLSLLTVIAALLIVLTYRLVDRQRRTTLPVVRERATQQRGSLISLSLQGPLLESVHDESEVERRFSDELAHYQRDAVRSLTSSIWKTPVLILVSSILAGLFLLVSSVQILRDDSSLSVAGMLTFLLCVLAAIVSTLRLQRSLRELQSVENAADALEHFLSLPVEEYDTKSLKSISKITQEVVMDHVTVQDSSGRKLLDNVSARFTPGKLIGVIASHSLQSRALVELLMGFGRPVSGRLLFDNQPVTDLQPESLSHCSHWVSQDGAIVTGTVRENLVHSQAVPGYDIDEAIVDGRLTEVLQQLPDGLATLITPGDDRLRGDAAFRIGIGRARVLKASIVVIEEPESHIDQQVEQQTLDAIRSLVRDESIAVVLPQRLMTLRLCDQVIVIHDHKVVDIGSHADLLQKNELYRHLNYLRFNPFRTVAS